MEEVIVNHEDMLAYIETKLFLDKKIINAVLEAEAETEYLKEKGIID